MASFHRERSQVYSKPFNHYSLHRVNVCLQDTLEQDSVILAIVPVVLCCWCLSQLCHQLEMLLMLFLRCINGKFYEDTVYPQSLALQRSRAPGFSEFIRCYNGQRLEGDQFAILFFPAESKLSRMGFNSTLHGILLILSKKLVFSLW